MHKRSDRIAENIHEIVSGILLRGLNDPRIGFVTITGVEVTEDLHLARIFFTVVGDEAARKNTEAGLNSARGFIRHELGKALKLRYTPDILFKYDSSLDYGNRIDDILKQIGPSHDEHAEGDS